MKKLVLLLAVVFSVSLFSCGNGEKKAEATDSVAAAAEEVVAAEVDTIVAPVDSAAADTVVAEVVEAVAAE